MTMRLEYELRKVLELGSATPKRILEELEDGTVHTRLSCPGWTGCYPQGQPTQQRRDASDTPVEE